MNHYLNVWKKYAQFKGRANRKQFWCFALINSIVIFILTCTDMLLSLYNPTICIGLLSGLYLLAVMIPNLAVIVRRLHDINKSGWWYLISLLPYIGFLAMFILLLLKGDQNSNQYGMKPS